jgi:outer membrane protein insertion porin family
MSNTFAGVGGDISYLKHIFSGTVYYSPLDDVVTSLQGTAGMMNKTGKKIRISDTFMLGADSFRGFEYGGLGPRDISTGDPLGGMRYWVTTAEVLFPIGLPNEFGVKGALFTDWGSVWKAPVKDKNTVDKSSVRGAVGAGLLWKSPFGPLRIDYAVRLKKEKYDRQQQFLFGFSTRF